MGAENKGHLLKPLERREYPILDKAVESDLVLQIEFIEQYSCHGATLLENRNTIARGYGNSVSQSLEDVSKSFTDNIIHQISQTPPIPGDIVDIWIAKKNGIVAHGKRNAGNLPRIPSGKTFYLSIDSEKTTFSKVYNDFRETIRRL